MLALLVSVNFSCSSDDGTTQEEQANSISYNLEVSGKYTTDWCGVENNTSKIKLSFIEDGNVKSTTTGESNVQLQSETFNENLSGNTIGVKLELQDYDPGNLTGGSYGDGFEQLAFKISNNADGTVIVDKEINDYYLVHCTDIVYEVTILYNVGADDINITSEMDNL